MCLWCGFGELGKNDSGVIGDYVSMNDFPSVVWRSRQVALGLEKGVVMRKCEEEVEGGLVHY